MSLIEKALGKMRTERESQGAQPAVAPASDNAVAAAPQPVPVRNRAPAKFDPSVLNSASRRVIAVNESALRDGHVLPPTAEARRVADEYRTIKRALIRSAFENSERASTPSLQIVTLTSALPGDGKTQTSINLALSIAREKDYQVVLVDADVAKPHVSALFNMEQELGLLTVLASPDASIRDVVLATDNPKLWLVPAGPPSENATELLASDRMAEVLQELVELFPNAIILLDAPPLLLTSEARVLVTAAGLVLMVVKAGETPRQAVMEAIEMTQDPDRVRLIFNQIEPNGLTNYYYGNWQPYGKARDAKDEPAPDSASK